MSISNHEDLLAIAEARTALNLHIKSLLVESLGLEIAPELIGDDQPLFGRGMGLDSLDSLELVVLVEQHFGVTLSSDQSGVFSSVNRLADYVITDRGEIPAVKATE